MHTSKEINMKTKMMRENSHQIIFIHLPKGKRCCSATMFLLIVPIVRGIPSNHFNLTFYPKCVREASVNIK